MNFISKNLGWIMLFLFFLFMLFIISTNQKADLAKNATGALMTDSGAVVSDEAETEELNNLIDKLSETKESEESEEKMEDEVMEEEASSTGSTAMNLVDEESKKKKWSLFDYFRKPKKDDTDSDKESEGKMTEESHTGSTMDEDDKDSESMEAMSDNTTEETSTSSVKADSKVVASNLSGLSKNKTAPSSVESQYPFKTIGTIVPQELPGKNLELAVGKRYEVGVYSLRLNNRFFNKTLAFMMEGDVVEQMTDAKGGCFKVKIISSSNSKNIGKIGFVTKGYLRDTTSHQTVTVVDTSTSDSQNSAETQPTADNSAVRDSESTQVAPTVTVAEPATQEVVVATVPNEPVVTAPVATPEYYNPTVAMQLKDAAGNDLTLMGQADVLKKIGEEDANGCFQVRIVGSNYCDNQGVVGYVCKADLSSYTPANQ